MGLYLRLCVCVSTQSNVHTPFSTTHCLVWEISLQYITITYGIICAFVFVCIVLARDFATFAVYKVNGFNGYNLVTQYIVSLSL